MKENNTQVTMTTTPNTPITITLNYGPIQSTATEKPEIDLANVDNDTFDEAAHNRDYFSKDEAEDMISQARRDALGDADDDEFSEEAHERGYYKPSDDDYELNQEGYYTIEDALEEADDYDFSQEAERRDWHSDEEYHQATEAVKEYMIQDGWVGPDSKEEAWEEAANDHGYYRTDQILDKADMDELIDAINSRRDPSNLLMTADTWTEQAREEGWLSPEQVARLLADRIGELVELLQKEQNTHKEVADKMQQEMRKALDIKVG